MGIITENQSKALHELTPSNIKDLDTAFDIIEHMINDIYDIPTKANRLKDKRNKT